MVAASLDAERERKRETEQTDYITVGIETLVEYCFPPLIHPRLE